MIDVPPPSPPKSSSSPPITPKKKKKYKHIKITKGVGFALFLASFGGAGGLIFSWMETNRRIPYGVTCKIIIDRFDCLHYFHAYRHW